MTVANALKELKIKEKSILCLINETDPNSVSYPVLVDQYVSINVEINRLMRRVGATLLDSKGNIVG